MNFHRQVDRAADDDTVDGGHDEDELARKEREIIEILEKEERERLMAAHQPATPSDDQGSFSSPLKPPVDPLWTPCGPPLDPLWTPVDPPWTPVDPPWTPCGPPWTPVDPLWTPCGPPATAP